MKKLNDLDAKILYLHVIEDIVFHSIRHSSTTYKLIISGGDIKTVQGDNGHATADMVVNKYSHIQDQTRRSLADTLEKDFYADEKTLSMKKLMMLQQKIMRTIQT